MANLRFKIKKLLLENRGKGNTTLLTNAIIQNGGILVVHNEEFSNKITQQIIDAEEQIREGTCLSIDYAAEHYNHDLPIVLDNHLVMELIDEFQKDIVGLIAEKEFFEAKQELIKTITNATSYDDLFFQSELVGGRIRRNLKPEQLVRYNRMYNKTYANNFKAPKI